jgi:hypothetical protein
MMEFMPARLMLLLLLLCLVVDSSRAADVTETTVCELVQHPKRYKGRMVRFAAEWTRTPRWIVVDEPGGECEPILVALPTESGIHPRPRFAAVEDAQLEKFLDSSFVLVLNPKTQKRGKIMATLQGRFDVAFPRWGFGHGKLYRFRIVLEQVSNVFVEDGQD